MKRFPVLLRDLAILAGGGCLVGGAWLAWPPLGLILGGGLLIGTGVLWQLDAERRQAELERRRRLGL